MFTLDTLTVPEVAPSTAAAYKVDGEFCTYEKQSDTVIVFKVGRASNLFKKLWAPVCPARPLLRGGTRH